MATAKAAVVVLYNHPKDAAEFEQYYNATHVPLVGEHADTLGVRRVELTKLASPDGAAPAFYRKAELWFDSEQAMKAAMATPEWRSAGKTFSMARWAIRLPAVARRSPAITTPST